MNWDVVIPTLRHEHAWEAIESLTHIPIPYRLHLISEPCGWSKAVNLGFQRGTSDVLLMDDDIRLKADTFLLIEKIYDDADIFGFKLIYDNGRIQHAGGKLFGEKMDHLFRNQIDCGQADKLYYACHVTTSLVLIKRKVIEKIGGMDETFPGMLYEDVDFSFRALKAGFRILYQPGMAVHLQSMTKGFEPDLHEKMKVNWNELKQRHLLDPEFVEFIREFPRHYRSQRAA